MDKEKILEIMDNYRGSGWVLEPDAKRILELAGIDVARFSWASTAQRAIEFAEKIGYPVVAKVVSPRVMHKTEVGGVVTGIKNAEMLEEAFHKLSRIEGFHGIIVDETLTGVELIVGARNDNQFGPIILLGVGGVGVELYRDVSIRMVPVNPQDVDLMIRSLRARNLVEGFRGAEPVNRELLVELVVRFSDLVSVIAGEIESVDLNPVMCSSQRVAVADARIVLNPPSGPLL